MQHELIAAPFLDGHLLVRPGLQRGVRVGAGRYRDVAEAAPGAAVPGWLAEAARAAWGLEVAGAPLHPTVLVRSPGAHGLGYGRASWEINKGCDYACDHCYLGLKRFEGLAWDGKEKLLTVMRDAGVLWLQITGGEPLIDRDFPAAYALACDLGMMVQVSSNGSQLSKPRILELFTERRPYRLTLSVYGATAETYDGFTHSRGGFDRFTRGLAAAREAGLPVMLNIVVAEANAGEVAAMQALADSYGFPHHVFTDMSPTIQGTGEPIPTQSEAHFVRRPVFRGCNAGHTFFHADPFGMASVCKIGRDPAFDVVADGLQALLDLDSVADAQQERTGGCSGCQLSGTCFTCRPMAKLFQEAGAPRRLYCQHQDPAPERG